MHFHRDVDVVARVLVGRIDGAADEEGYVGRLLEEGLREEGGPVLAEAPLEIEGIASEVILGDLHHLVEGNDPLGDEIDALDVADRGNLRVEVVDVGQDRLLEVARHDLRRGAAAHHVLASAGEEETHRLLVVVGIGWRAYEDVDRFPFPLLDDEGRRIVPRPVIIKGRAVVDEEGSDVFGRNRVVVKRFQVMDDLVASPAEVHRLADSGVKDAVRHEDEGIPGLHLYLVEGNPFPLHHRFLDGNGEFLAVSEVDREGIVVVIDIEDVVPSQFANREGRVGDVPPAFGNRKGLDHRLDAFFDAHPAFDHP